MKKYRTADYLDNIFAISRAGKELGIDLGFSLDIWLNAVRHGGVPAGEDADVRAIMTTLFPATDWAALRQAYVALTDEEKERDLDEFFVERDARLARM